MAIYTTLTIDQGSDFTATISLTDANGLPLNIGNQAVYSQMRKSYVSTTSYSFMTGVVNSSSGVITISMPASTSLTIKPGRYVFDVITVTSSTSQSRVLEGQVELTPAVTLLS